jgi:hypothetical protein
MDNISLRLREKDYILILLTLPFGGIVLLGQPRGRKREEGIEFD